MDASHDLSNFFRFFTPLILLFVSSFQNSSEVSFELRLSSDCSTLSKKKIATKCKAGVVCRVKVLKLKTRFVNSSNSFCKETAKMFVY